jgi:C-terminal processing protease CtpA/Prc
MDRKLAKTNKNYIKDLKRYSSNREIINNVFQQINQQYMNETNFGKFSINNRDNEEKLVDHINLMYDNLKR